MTTPKAREVVGNLREYVSSRRADPDVSLIEDAIDLIIALSAPEGDPVAWLCTKNDNGDSVLRFTKPDSKRWTYHPLMLARNANGAA